MGATRVHAQITIGLWSLRTVHCSLCFVLCALCNVDGCYSCACSDHYRFVRMSAAALWVPLRSLHVPVLVSTLRSREKESVGDGFVSFQDIFNLPVISRHPMMSPILFLSMSGQTTKDSQTPQLGLVLNFRKKAGNFANQDT